MSTAPNPYGRENVRKGIGHYVTGRALAAVISLVVVLLMVRSMPVMDYGIFVTATGVATILVMFSNCGLERVVLKFLPEGRVRASPADLAAFVAKIVGLRMAAVFALVGLVIAAHGWLFGLLHIPSSVGIILATATYTVLLAFTDFSLYCLQALMLQRHLRLGVSIGWLARLLVVGVFLVNGWPLNVGVVLWIWALAEFIAALVMAVPLITLIQAGRRHAATATHSGEWPSHDSGFRVLAASNFLSTLISSPWQPNTLRTIAGALLPPHQVAAYGFFQILIERIRSYLPSNFFASMTEPLMSAHITGGEHKQHVLDHMAILVQASVWVLAPMITLLAVSGQPIVNMLTGDKYGEYSAILAILLCQVLLGLYVALLWSFFSVIGESKAIWRSTVIPSIAILPFLIYCGTRYGIFGMALAAPVNTACVLLLMVRRLQTFGYVLPLNWPSLGRIFLLGVLAALPAWGVLTHEAAAIPARLLLLMVLAACGVIYLVGSFFSPPFSEAQRYLVVRLVPGSTKLFRTKSLKIL